MSAQATSAAGAIGASLPAPRSRLSRIWRQVRRRPIESVGAVVLLMVVTTALAAGLIAPHDYAAQEFGVRLTAPGSAYLFGTDSLGRDVFSRVIVATRLDFFIAVASVALVFLMGGLAGVAAGFFGGWTDRIVGRLADTIMAFPLFVLAMGIVAALGNTVQNIIIATAIVNFPLYARVARAEANVRREAGFVQESGMHDEPLRARRLRDGVDPGAVADDAHPEDALGAGLDDQLGEAVGAVEGEGASAGPPGELGDLHRDAALLGLLFGEADPSHLGIGEHHGGHHVVAVHRPLAQIGRASCRERV
mgnify:CR=1 FL=1